MRAVSGSSALLHQLSVRVAPTARGDGLVDRRGEQRVLEVDTARSVDADDARLLCRLECLSRGDARRRRGQRGCQHQCVAASRAGDGRRRDHQFLDAGGHRG